MKKEIQKTVISYPIYRKWGGYVYYKVISPKQMIKVENFSYYSKAIEFNPMTNMAFSDKTEESSKKEFDMAFTDVMRYFKSLEKTYA
jgi:hypothetical protein